MRALAPVALVLVLLPSAQAALLITGFATNLPGQGDDDAFELSNSGPEDVPLANVTVSDVEGALGFPANASLASGARLVVASDAEAYGSAARRMPDYAIAGPAPHVRIVSPNFALAQRGDELLLLQSGKTIDAVRWGTSSDSATRWNGPPLNATSTALRWFERTPGHDSDTKADWEQPQQPRLGWRTHELPTFAVASGTAFTAPDRSREAVSDFLRRAEHSLRLNVYEFRDTGLARDLLGNMAAHEGLDVRLLVDEKPVGLDAEEKLVRDRILQDLAGAGADVHLLRHDRYNFDHAKYAIADERWVLIESENLVPSAMPADGREGNRGWGIVLDSPETAQALARVFDDDFILDDYGARGLGPSEDAPVPLPDFVTATPRPRFEQASAARFNATLVVAPEANLEGDDALLSMLAAAKDEILVEQLRIARTWRDSSGRDWPNDYLNALLEAARRGVHVRVLMDGHFLDEEDADDNADTLAAIQEASELLPIDARLMEGSDDPVLHVKGVVVDRRVSWIGSMNWNLNSVAQNREVSVRVDAPRFAELFRDAFDADWSRADAPHSTKPGIPGPGFLLIATVIIGTVLARRLRGVR